jgi:hypothetical protein
MTPKTWRDELEALLAVAIEQSGLAEVTAVLRDHIEALAAHPDAPVDPFRPRVPILGTMPCAAGFLGVLVQPDGRTSVHVARTIDGLLAQVRETVEPVVIAEGTDGTNQQALLAAAGFTAPAWFSGSGFSPDELVAACVAVLEAQAET